jgi:hypothetical protein
MYNSTLEGSQLMVGCEYFPNNMFTALCHQNASWYPNPAYIDCSNSSTSTEIEQPEHISSLPQEGMFKLLLYTYACMQYVFE